MKSILIHWVFIGYSRNKRVALAITLPHSSSYIFTATYTAFSHTPSGKRTHRNIELMWLLERLQPNFKTIADFIEDNGKAKIYTPSKVNFHIEHVEKNIQQYLSKMDTQDNDEKSNSNKVPASKLAWLK